MYITHATGGVWGEEEEDILGELLNGEEVSIGAVQSATDAVCQQSHHYTVIGSVVTTREALWQGRDSC